MSGARNVKVTSHSLYADDILIFCKGKQSNISFLNHVFSRYYAAYRKVFSQSKFTIFLGSISDDRFDHFVANTGFSKGSFPFKYIGVPILKVKAKASHLQPNSDEILAKLSSRKRSLLSIAGKIFLVRGVIQSVLIHSIFVYACPVETLRTIETTIRNFIWSGDIKKRKMVIVSWKTLCFLIKHGGLGLRSHIFLNEARSLKLCWDLMQSVELWAKLLKARVKISFGFIRHHIYSSPWSSIKT